MDTFKVFLRHTHPGIYIESSFFCVSAPGFGFGFVSRPRAFISQKGGGYKGSGIVETLGR